jgi:hypothetical protein
MGEAQYLNTDLDLESGDDLSPLTDELHLQKWAVLHSSRHDDGVYRAGLEHTQKVALSGSSEPSRTDF